MHVATINPRRHIEDGGGVGPVFGQVENDVDDLVWQKSRRCEMLAERYDGSH